ncbi:uncharacterized protein LTR77_010597 [Saxophila tyrrhenica]|uniref:ASX DEUBAD domain-containing protein n=1 Tax=Saxophila tyrrhenica TaxID=1690608 RepID=A0AAV9NVB3_9PEZI|nr:hypothetical protein LTR77_010597 [Saxophila tyrrhenica]
MAAQQKRLITQPTSKLGKLDICTILRKEDSWTLLPRPTREELYTLLPAPRAGEPAHDPDVHPLRTNLKPFIEEELRVWQEDLKEGREAKKWRVEAMQAGKDRREGKFEEGMEVCREEYWGKREVGEELVRHEDGVKGEVGSEEAKDADAADV